MVHSSTLIVTTEGEHLTCGGFSLGETVHFGSLEFIPRGATQAPSSWERPTAGHLRYIPSSRAPLTSSTQCLRHSMGTPPALIAITPLSDDAPTPQTKMMVLPQTITLWPDVRLPPER
jgi:hypothetical protein